MLNRNFTTARVCECVSLSFLFVLSTHFAPPYLLENVSSASFCYFINDIISFMLLLCSQFAVAVVVTVFILSPTLTNDNSLIHPLSISHFYDEPNRIPSHRLSFNVLPFMVIQLIHNISRPFRSVYLCSSPASPFDVWFYIVDGIIFLAKDKKQ